MNIVRSTHGGIFVLPISALELENRIISIEGEINGESLARFRKEFCYLSKQNSDTIHVLISSYGGDCNAGMAIVDMIAGSKIPVSTICVGIAASMGAVIFAAGHKGMRYMLAHSRLMIHEPLISNAPGGNASSLIRTSEELAKTRKEIAEVLAHSCGKTVETVLGDMQYDHFLSAEESKEYGFCDDIVSELPV